MEELYKKRMLLAYIKQDSVWADNDVGVRDEMVLAEVPTEQRRRELEQDGVELGECVKRFA